MVRQTAYEIEMRFAALRAATDVMMSAAPKVADKAAPLPLPTRYRSLSEVTELYLADPSSGRTEKSAMAYRTVFSVILGIVGADMPITALTREVCRDVLTTLQRLPPNASKRWPDFTPVEAVEQARAEGIPPMSASNVNGYMNKFAALLNWAAKEEMIVRNPAKGLRIADAVARRDKRRPFTLDQLRRIFGAPLYTGCRDDGHGYAVVGAARPRRARFWVPLIALYSGMRQNEICQLDTSDVRDIDGIACFVVSAGGSEDKRLKTSASERVVPVHPALVRIGFLDYLDDRRRAFDTKLFPELLTERFGYYSVKFSKWFARFLLSCGAAAERTCFHSFRHSFRDALREARVDREVALAIGGWTSPLRGDAGAVADLYGRGYSPKPLFDALSAVEYPGLDLSHLYTR